MSICIPIQVGCCYNIICGVNECLWPVCSFVCSTCFRTLSLLTSFVILRVNIYFDCIILNTKKGPSGSG